MNVSGECMELVYYSYNFLQINIYFKIKLQKRMKKMNL